MYNFAPMMPFYNKFLQAPPGFLSSKQGKEMIDKVMEHCRTKHGNEEAENFLNAITVLTVTDKILK